MYFSKYLHSHRCSSMRAHCSQPKKISSLTLKAFGPEVTVCYPVKRNKCMSDLEKCWELNCIKALSLPELQTNWIKLEKQLPMCTDPFFFSPPKLIFLGGEMLTMFYSTPSFVLVNIPQMRFPKSGGEGEHACSSAQSKHCQTDTPLTPACWLPSLFLSCPY